MVFESLGWLFRPTEFNKQLQQVQENDQNLTEFNFTETVSGYGTKHLSLAIATNQFVSQLKLRPDPEDMDLLVKGLKDNQSVHTLQLHGHGTDSSKFFISLSDLLKTTTTIKTLELFIIPVGLTWSFDPNCIQELSFGLMENHSITKLDLSECRYLHKSDMTALAMALKINKHIEEIFLCEAAPKLEDFGRFDDSGKLFAEMLKENTSLKTLRAFFHMTEEELVLWSEALEENHTLNYLTLFIKTTAREAAEQLKSTTLQSHNIKNLNLTAFEGHYVERESEYSPPSLFWPEVSLYYQITMGDLAVTKGQA